MKKIQIAIGMLMVFATAVSADMFGTGDSQFTIEFVNIGNPGNAGDTRSEANPYGCGAVDYNYRIGKYEITNAQWNTFVAAAGAPTGNIVYGYGGDPYPPYDENAYWTGEDMPTNMVSWYEAAQFCNYLTSGDKSRGAYLFSGNNSNPGDFLGIDRSLAVSTFGTVYVLPTVDEWYKAAFYTGNGYSTYTNGTDIAPVAGLDANYGQGIPYGPWDVGSGTVEQNGTFDMIGNVYEWTETLTPDRARYLRSSTYYNNIGSIESSIMVLTNPSKEILYIGLRVASIPEPATLLLLALGGLALRLKQR